MLFPGFPAVETGGPLFGLFSPSARPNRRKYSSGPEGAKGLRSLQCDAPWGAQPQLHLFRLRIASAHRPLTVYRGGEAVPDSSLLLLPLPLLSRLMSSLSSVNLNLNLNSMSFFSTSSIL